MKKFKSKNFYVKKLGAAKPWYKREISI